MSKNINKSHFLISLILLIGDVVALYTSFYLGAQIRTFLVRWMGGVVYWPVYQSTIFLLIGFVILLFFVNNLYPGYGITAVKEMEKLFKNITLIFGLFGGIIFYFRIYLDFPRSIIAFAWILSLGLIPLFRFLFRNRLSLSDMYGVPIALITDDAEDYTLNAIFNCRRMGWNPKVVYSYHDKSQGTISSDVKQVFSWNEMLRNSENLNIDIAVLTSPYDTKISLDIRRLRDTFKRLIMVLPYYNLGSLWVKPRDLEGNLALEIEYHLLDPITRFVKRIIDIIGSLVFIVLFSPLLIILSLAIYIDSPGPIFYRQKRLGKNKEIFNALKFRSMIVNAEKKLDEVLENEPEARREYQKYHKLRNDPRITNLGRFLRKFSLDELPQLWNVLKGEMSLCGPRAYMPSELGDIGDFAEVILRVKPGMTGWWQVMGRHNTTFDYRLRMDEYYISNWSLWLDLYILYKTVWVVISGTGT